MLIAHRGLSEDLAYLVTKTICERHRTLAKAHKPWSRFDPRRAGDPQETGVPLHPGARRCYEEQGWLERPNEKDGDER